MGTDIRVVYEKFENDQWAAIDVYPEYDFSRNYLLFAVLADVRNGLGFGGVPTHEPIEPIDYPRGLPEDYVNPDDHENWDGDHSVSWLMLSEILDYFKEQRIMQRYAIITAEQYENWEYGTKPTGHWTNGVWGPDVKLHDVRDSKDKVDLPPDVTHVRISWCEDIATVLAHYVELFESLYEDEGDVRLVFGFDS